MTEETKTRAPKNSKPLGAGEAFDLIMTRLDARAEAIAAFAKEWDRRQAEIEQHTFARVPENQRERLERMIKEEMRAKANGANDPSAPEAGQGSDDFTTSYGDPPADDGIPERLKTNVEPAERIEIDRSTGESRRVGPGRR